MERKSVVSEKPTWRKTTQGTLYPFPKQRSRRVKFKESIQATPEELGNKINQFQLINPGSGEYKIDMAGFQQTPEEEGQEAPKKNESSPNKETYTVEHVGGGYYDVKSSTGKVMNEKKLRSADAEALKETLEQETLGEE